MGWKAINPYSANEGIVFSLDAFSECREWLIDHGIDCFNGNADLILIDAIYENFNCYLDFSNSIHIDLSAAVIERDFETLGSFLAALIRATKEAISQREEGSPTFRISDTLGIATAQQSFLNYMFSKWGKLIGAKKLHRIAVKSIGPKILLEEFEVQGVPVSFFHKSIPGGTQPIAATNSQSLRKHVRNP